MILLYHGIFTFADDAKESYLRMIRYISKAEKELKQKSKSIKIKKYTEKKIKISDVSNIIRQQISIPLLDRFQRKIVYFYKPPFLDEFFLTHNYINLSIKVLLHQIM